LHPRGNDASQLIDVSIGENIRRMADNFFVEFSAFDTEGIGEGSSIYQLEELAIGGGDAGPGGHA